MNYKYLFYLLFALFVFTTSAKAQTEKSFFSNWKLPNGWSLSPVGKTIPLGDLPLNMAVSPNKKYIVITNNGQKVNSLQLLNIATNKIVDSLVVDKLWYGLAFDKKNATIFYASAGNDNKVLKFAILKDRLILLDSFILGKKWPTPISPTGLCISNKRKVMYVVTKDNNKLYEIDLSTKHIISTVDLPAEAYTCMLSHSENELYISIWGLSKLLIYNTYLKKIIAQIPTGSHPNEFCLSKNGALLYVANGEDNSVSVIDIKKRTTIETLNAALYPDAPTGSGTNSVVLDDHKKVLYIANADNNCISVFDVSKTGHAVSKGFIPVGWYPTNVKLVNDMLYVVNGKGFTSFANPLGPDPYNINAQLNLQKGLLKNLNDVQYIGGLMKGTLSYFKIPTTDTLKMYSKQVYANTPYSKDKELTSQVPINSIIPKKIGEYCPIKHVFYIIKENRTYDQVLGDMGEGNGDSSLCLFGRKITPNLHALASEFVLLDNFYVDGEVSADGHNWSMGAYANDYLEKNWVTSYGGRGGTYDAEGTRAIANNKNGFIWDFAKRSGISYRTYGEFADDFKPNLPVLENHFCKYYSSWDQTVRDTTRVNQWKRDFDSLIKINKVPQLSTLRLINDHTEGLQLGRPTPNAHVADNDLAVGMFVDYLSKSNIWDSSVVFILEDDAQDGPDHVDAHRSTAYVAGAFVKRHFVDHTMYSTSSMLKTIELILGLPPMSQYDAGATPMWNCFNNKIAYEPFNYVPTQYDLNEKNTTRSKMQLKSESFNFKKEDRVNEQDLNEVLWLYCKGDYIKMPEPIRAAFLNVVADKELDKH